MRISLLILFIHRLDIPRLVHCASESKLQPRQDLDKRPSIAHTRDKRWTHLHIDWVRSFSRDFTLSLPSFSRYVHRMMWLYYWIRWTNIVCGFLVSSEKSWIMIGICREILGHGFDQNFFNLIQRIDVTIRQINRYKDKYLIISKNYDHFHFQWFQNLKKLNLMMYTYVHVL